METCTGFTGTILGTRPVRSKKCAIMHFVLQRECSAVVIIARHQSSVCMHIHNRVCAAPTFPWSSVTHIRSVGASRCITAVSLQWQLSCLHCTFPYPCTLQPQQCWFDPPVWFAGARIEGIQPLCMFLVHIRIASFKPVELLLLRDGFTLFMQCNNFANITRFFPLDVKGEFSMILIHRPASGARYTLYVTTKEILEVPSNLFAPHSLRRSSRHKRPCAK